MLTARLNRLAARTAGRLTALARGREGVSAVEFGLLAPVLVVMLGGVAEFSGAITAANRSTYAADALAEMVSRVDHTLTDAELKNFAISSVLIDLDIVRYAHRMNQNVEDAFEATISSVQFEPKDAACTGTDCKYTAKTVFSYTLNGTKRPCGELTAAAAASPTTLPPGVFGPGSLVAVDIKIKHAPLMPVRLSETISFERHAYFRPRYLTRINSVKNCSGV